MSAAAAPRPSGRRDLDWALSLVSLAGALFCTWLLSANHAATSFSSELPPVAKLSLSKAEVRRRPIGTLGWNELDVGAPVYEADSIFVPPGSAASLTFEDGSQLDVEENSLVVIERPARGDGPQTQVQLVRGRASGVSGTKGMELRAGDFATALPANAGATIDVQPGKNAQVEVFAGTAMVKTRSGAHPLDENHAAKIAPNGALETAQLAVTLTSPSRGARHYFQQKLPSIALSWKPADEQSLVVELALDRGFNQVVFSAQGLAGTQRFEPRQAGTFWWRVVGGDGGPRSEIRTLEVLEDLPPTPSSPGNDEQIDTATRTISFAWSAVQNAPGYRVELSKQEDFSSLAFWAEPAPNRLIIREPLPEGRYHWRVRTLDPERGESPFSQARSFILIDRPLPDAPELIDSALEVTGGKKKR